MDPDAAGPLPTGAGKALVYLPGKFSGELYQNDPSGYILLWLGEIEI